MGEETNPRIRTNAKQTSKGDWYFDVTVETESGIIPADLLVSVVNEVKAKFKAAGLRIVNDGAV
jgi:hypothetical protein